ncbi:MAG: hypothetical protein JXJ17_04595 [Anaerolineae bacterium]|nr:hypothetical protein [Anaerolineae bacterium]
MIAVVAVMTITACAPVDATAIPPTPSIQESPTVQPPTATPIPTNPPPTEVPSIDCTESALREAVAAGGEIVLTPDCTYHLTADLPSLNTDIDISGNNAVIDGGGQYAVFFSQNTDIKLDSLTIQNAYHNNHSPAIYTEEGRISVYDGYFYNNQTETEGGAIGTQAGSIEITAGEFRGNAAVFNGGAISSHGSWIDILETTFVENTSVGCGAAIYIDAGELQVENSAFVANEVTVHGGGALCLTDATLTAAASTFSGNRSARGGGAIAAVGGNVEIVTCTITNNTAGRGGGIWTDGSVTLQQSIIAGNSAQSATDILIEGNQEEPFISLGYNLIGAAGNLSLDDTDIANQPCGLGSLADGGHIPLDGSPALDAVPTSECADSLDQYGYPRPQGAGCDIGAVERQE